MFAVYECIRGYRSVESRSFNGPTQWASACLRLSAATWLAAKCLSCRLPVGLEPIVIELSLGLEQSDVNAHALNPSRRQIPTTRTCVVWRLRLSRLRRRWRRPNRPSSNGISHAQADHVFYTGSDEFVLIFVVNDSALFSMSLLRFVKLFFYKDAEQ